MKKETSESADEVHNCIMSQILQARKNVAGKVPRILKLNQVHVFELADYLFKHSLLTSDQIVPTSGDSASVAQIVTQIKAGKARILGMKVEFHPNASEVTVVAEATV